jgi:enamine deaminase RidA (YjgF/YER057c/UK114 family)
MSIIEAQLESLGFTLPDAPKAMGNFAPSLIDESNLYISGQVSIDLNDKIIQGKLGDNLTLEQGQEAARYCAINLLARAKAALTNIDRIEKLVKLGAFVNATPDFSQHPQVVNGASDFMVNVLGKKKGRHVRFAVG